MEKNTNRETERPRCDLANDEVVIRLHVTGFFRNPISPPPPFLCHFRPPLYKIHEYRSSQTPGRKEKQKHHHRIVTLVVVSIRKAVNVSQDRRTQIKAYDLQGTRPESRENLVGETRDNNKTKTANQTRDITITSER